MIFSDKMVYNSLSIANFIILFLLFVTVNNCRVKIAEDKLKCCGVFFLLFFHFAVAPSTERTYSTWDYWSVELNLCLFVLSHTLILSH